jgi:hypothetical protein
VGRRADAILCLADKALIFRSRDFIGAHCDVLLEFIGHWRAPGWIGPKQHPINDFVPGDRCVDAEGRRPAAWMTAHFGP